MLARPMSNWTELDVWLYIHLEEIPIVPLYKSAPRPVIERVTVERRRLDRQGDLATEYAVAELIEDGEVQRNDEDYSYVAAWAFSGDTAVPALHKEQLRFEFVHPSVRSYK